MKLKLVLLPLLLAGCAADVKTVSTSFDEAVTKQVLDHHLQTFQANDLDGVMADYTEESVLITPDATYTGLEEIRQNFVNAFGALPNPGTTMTVTKSVVSKDVAYIVWTAITPTLNFKYATDTFIVQDGKIVRQTYAGDVVPLAAAGEDAGD